MSTNALPSPHSIEGFPRNAGESSVPDGYSESRSSESDVSTASTGLLGRLGNLHRDILHQILPGRSATDSIIIPKTLVDSSPISNPGHGISHALPIDQTEKYLERFQTSGNYFTFVQLPMDHSVSNMRQNHPFLLLGILCAMTVHEVRLNSRLHAELLRTLSDRVIIGGEENLDIIQGLLVQLAWYGSLFKRIRIPN
jgi:hypothetical protein